MFVLSITRLLPHPHCCSSPVANLHFQQPVRRLRPFNDIQAVERKEQPACRWCFRIVPQCPAGSWAHLIQWNNFNHLPLCKWGHRKKQTNKTQKMLLGRLLTKPLLLTNKYFNFSFWRFVKLQGFPVAVKSLSLCLGQRAAETPVCASGIPFCTRL